MEKQIDRQIERHTNGTRNFEVGTMTLKELFT